VFVEEKASTPLPMLEGKALLDKARSLGVPVVGPEGFAALLDSGLESALAHLIEA
jgi:hypothetical protein